MNKNIMRGLVAVGALLLVATAKADTAAIDVSAVTSGISDAGTALLAVLTALLAMSTSIFGLSKVYGFVKRKAGA